ncbi:MAG: lipoate--protein ligase family protein [Candidatus Latescibacterota bacterium]
MQGMKWRFLDTGKGSAFFNMALDEAILRAVRAGESSPVFRLYGWEPEAITVGYSQNASTVLDLGKCGREGVPVTRRLTGGRAVFHADEVTYSVIGSVEDPRFGGTLMDTYRAISRVLLDAVAASGADAEWSRGESGASRNPAAVGAAPCFLSVSRYEITLGGRKMVGSAQRRIGGFFLQQGSILTGPGHERIADYLGSAEAAGKAREAMAKKTVDLASAMRHPVSIDTFKKLLAESFARAAELEVYRDEPTPSEIEYAHRAAEERYGSKGWVMGHEK